MALARAYGGVVFDDAGRVLLREPANHYDGYVWTFAKGRPDPGEEPEASALREVFEETGVRASIVQRIPGSFGGGTTENVYWVMRCVEDTGRFGSETQRVAWLTPDEARAHIAKTTNSTGRKRDLAVLAAAEEVLPCPSP